MHVTLAGVLYDKQREQKMRSILSLLIRKFTVSYSVVQASVMYVMVSIQNTYVWIAPENRSKYT